MPFLIDGHRPYFLTGALSAAAWVETPYLFNNAGGGAMQVPGVSKDSPDSFVTTTAVQTMAHKTLLRPIVTSATVSGATVAAGSLSGVAITLSNPAIAGGSYTQPVITSATMTSPTISGGGTWASGTLSSPRITSGIFTNPTIAGGTNSFMVLQSCTLQTCSMVSPAIAMSGGTGSVAAQASGGVIANAVIGNLTYFDQQSSLNSYNIIDVATNMATGQITLASMYYKPAYCQLYDFFIYGGSPLAIKNAATGQIVGTRPRQYQNTWNTCQITGGVGSAVLIAGTHAVTSGTGAVDFYLFLFDGSNYCCISKQLDIH